MLDTKHLITNSSPVGIYRKLTSSKECNF